MYGLTTLHTREKLWEAISILKGYGYRDNANVVFKLIVESTFLSLKMPTDIIENYIFDISSSGSYEDMRVVDSELYDLIHEGDPAAYARLVVYIELLIGTIPASEVQK